MASGKSTYLANKLAAVMANQGTYASPATLYVALFPADPGAGGTSSTEFTNTTFPGYGTTRLSITCSTVTANTGTSFSNTNDISWTNTGSSTVSVGGMGIYDSATIGAGNLLYHEGFATAYNVGQNQKLDFPAGNISISEA